MITLLELFIISYIGVSLMKYIFSKDTQENIYFIKDRFSKDAQEKYNMFADSRCMCCIPNFMDVMSNVIFMIVGIYLLQTHFVLGINTILVFFGSSYFHWNPTKDTLVFDRIPMMLLLSELISIKMELDIHMTTTIYVTSVFSVLYWWITDDLIPYSMFQVAPIIYFLIVGQYQMRSCVIMYMMAKIFEDNDKKIYDMTNKYISGHTLKHIAAGMALCFI